MTNEDKQFMAEALKQVKLDEGFAPAEVGKRIGMSKMQSETAARSLSEVGVLVLGFDHSAEFSPEYRKLVELAEETANRKAVKATKGTRAIARRTVQSA